MIKQEAMKPGEEILFLASQSPASLRLHGFLGFLLNLRLARGVSREELLQRPPITFGFAVR